MSQSAIEHQIREEMFAMLYKDFQKPIEWYLMGWVYNQEIASELCQDTFEYFWKFLRKETVVQSASKYKVDLYTTAKYRAIDHLRRHNKPIVYLPQSESEEDSWFEEPRAEGLEDLIDLIDLPDELLQLPEKQREYLVKYAKGHLQKEIAEEEDISEATVSEYMKKGRAELRKKSFAVTVDLKERQRVSRKINRFLYLTICDVLEQQTNNGNGVREEYFKKLVEEGLVDYIPELSADFKVEMSRYTEHEWEVLAESDLTVEDFDRYVERTIRKPLRRIFIDFENQKRGLLSGTAVLGQCGQYLF